MPDWGRVGHNEGQWFQTYQSRPPSRGDVGLNMAAAAEK